MKSQLKRMDHDELASTVIRGGRRAVAEMCGVSDHTVEVVRGPGAQNAHVKRTGRDGKQYPAKRKTKNSVYLIAGGQERGNLNIALGLSGRKI